MATGAMLIMLLTFAWSSLARAEPTAVELAYDDGDWGPYGSAWGVRGKQAVRFSLPDGWTSAKLLTAKYAMEEALVFRVHIYDSDGITELTTPFEVTPSTSGWFEVDLSGLGIFVSGDFYVARESVIPNYVGPYIYIDLSPPIDGRTYYMLEWQTIWTQRTDVDVGIRAVVEQAVPPIPAEVNIDPDTLNLKSNGEFITAYIELPSGHDVINILVQSILLNKTIPTAAGAPVTVADHDADGIPDLMVKFNRATVIDYIKTIDFGCDTGKFKEVTLTVSGALSSGEAFEGSDTAKIVI